ncbi:unnamed protein product, partial [Discosporangium mesarthrocarpum]
MEHPQQQRHQQQHHQQQQEHLHQHHHHHHHNQRHLQGGDGEGNMMEHKEVDSAAGGRDREWPVGQVRGDEDHSKNSDSLHPQAAAMGLADDMEVDPPALPLARAPAPQHQQQAMPRVPHPGGAQFNPPPFQKQMQTHGGGAVGVGTAGGDASGHAGSFVESSPAASPWPNSGVGGGLCGGMGPPQAAAVGVAEGKGCVSNE